MAAERGGNCELSEPDGRIQRHNITILGPTNLPAEVPHHASQMFSKNVTTLIQHLVSDGRFQLDQSDENTAATLSHIKERCLNPGFARLLVWKSFPNHPTRRLKKPTRMPNEEPTEGEIVAGGIRLLSAVITERGSRAECAEAAPNALQSPSPAKVAQEFTKTDALIAGLSIFVLAVFVGFEVITKVPPTLHTPLMSDQTQSAESHLLEPSW